MRRGGGGYMLTDQQFFPSAAATIATRPPAPLSLTHTVNIAATIVVFAINA